MKFYEGLVAAVCAAFCAVMFWCAVGLVEEPFYVCVCIFISAFWGSLAAFCIWGRLAERARRNEWRPSIIWPHGRRP